MHSETICSIATPNGTGAIAIIRISGEKSFEAAKKISFSKKLSKALEGHLNRGLEFVQIKDENDIIDECLLAWFRSPHSYTGEDSVEIYCHGSYYIQKTILELLLKHDIRLAKAGEFTMRAFANGKMDLLQAEAVADIIASNTQAAHNVAMNQMRGGFSSDLQKLRTQLIDFSALIELELDFSEEDIEFADRTQMTNVLKNIKSELLKLKESFSLGNVIKNGIPVAIVGKPNVGKSTLLNALLNEERAIVSNIPGTTRDALEDVVIMNGISFRFIDTAGLRKTDDTIENLGIDITYKKIEQADIVLYIVDINKTSFDEISEELSDFRQNISNPDKKFIVIANKIDLLNQTPSHFKDFVNIETIFMSAKRKENIQELKDILVNSAKMDINSENTVLTNIRHFESLQKAEQAIENIFEAFKNKIPTDLIAIDVKDCLYHIGSITGEVTSNDVLDAIFSRFCIGK
ncbi:MAG: tRNA uridine-5-carboxymethylaminomethyl(34) synthesis GTPase MnmE [Bacteroidales bacterium]|nr:tRNA uridine-5-carboxymethylaminomethyl(34) synthesis GTPase MnmE [Bacteroidales bacterium]